MRWFAPELYEMRRALEPASDMNKFHSRHLSNAEDPLPATSAGADIAAVEAIGTSGTVGPAASFARSAGYAGRNALPGNLEPVGPGHPAFQREILGLAEAGVDRQACTAQCAHRKAMMWATRLGGRSGCRTASGPWCSKPVAFQ